MRPSRFVPARAAFLLGNISDERSETMIELIRKTLATGLGLAFMTKEKIEELAKDFIEKGKLSEREAKDFIDDLSKKSKEARKKVEEELEKMVRKTVEKMNLVTRDDFLKLQNQLEELKKAVKEKDSEG